MIQNKRANIISVGTAVPERVLTNKDLEQVLNTTDAWITERTGIKQRHVFKSDDLTPLHELGALAARRALDNAKLGATDVDAIICATFTPDNFFPSTACRMQAALGCTNAFAFDLSAACAGFVYGLTMANSLIVSGQCKTVLLVGAEIISRTLDWTDRSTCILFGDGAGAVVMQATADEHRGVLSSFLMSDGTVGDILVLPARGEKCQMRMNGNDVYKNAVRMMGHAVGQALKKASLTADQMDLLIPHQANIRIINAIGEHFNIPREKIITNLDRFGNTSAASIPLALNEAWQAGRIKDGTLVVFTALGGGLACGSAVVRF